jgi:hypothetical protein
VSLALRRAKEAGLTWDAVQALEDDELEGRLYPRVAAEAERAEPAAGGAILIALMCGRFDMVERRAFQKRPYLLVRSAVIRRGGDAYRGGKSREVSINGRDEGPPRAVILGVCVMTMNRVNGVRTTLTTFPVLLAFQERRRPGHRLLRGAHR